MYTNDDCSEVKCPHELYCGNGGLSFIDINIIQLLSFVCLVIKSMTSFLRYTADLNFLEDHINHVYAILVPCSIIELSKNMTSCLTTCTIKPRYKVLR